MLRNPLVALDASAASDAAADAALMLARRLDGGVLGVHVVDALKIEGSFLRDLAGAAGIEPFLNLAPEFERMLGEKGRAILAAFADRARAAGVPATTELRRGLVATEIVAAGETRSVIVLGRVGEHASWKGPGELGPVTEAVARRARTPVWLAVGAVREPRRIVVGFDGSPRAARALEIARDLAEAFVGAVTVICAGDREADTGPRVQAALDLCRGAKVPVDVRGATGAPATAILDAAAETQADLVAVGAFGHNRLVEMLLGSTTSVVARHAATAVLLAR